MNALRPSTPVLRRACACGGTPGPAGECEACRAKRLRRSPSASTAGPAVAPPIVHDVLRSNGAPLDGSVRAEMEPRFRHSFADVRVHVDGRAAESARAVGAHAYAVGPHVVFGAGRYAPGSGEGRRLIAHELAHVVQQRGASASLQPKLEIGAADDPAEREADHAAAGAGAAVGPERGGPVLRRATFTVGRVQVQIRYDRLAHIVARGETATHFLLQYATYTGGTPDPALQAAHAALRDTQRVWVLYGMALLMDNTRPEHASLDRVRAVQRMVATARTSATQPLAGDGRAFAEEVLRATGWYEAALPAGLRGPMGVDLVEIREMYIPSGGGGGTAPASRLDRTRFEPAIRQALTAWLRDTDPAGWGTPTRLPLGQLQAVGTEVQALARGFFAPYAERAVRSTYATGWNYASNISSVTAAPVTEEARVALLLNRATMIGEDGGASSIFRRMRFNGAVDDDRRELMRIVTEMAADGNLRDVVRRVVEHTGRAQGGRVEVSTEVNPSLGECQVRWDSIKTICHELMHVLAHPRLAQQTRHIESQQIVREGFPEVLAYQLYYHVRDEATRSPALQARLEVGLTGPRCSPIPSTVVGYREAGRRAWNILQRVQNENFRAAYFLGATHLVGL